MTATGDASYDASMDLPPASLRLVRWAAGVGLDLDVRVFPEGTKTAGDAAGAVGCDVAAIVKSLVFMVDDAPVVALVPGDMRLDPDKLAEAAGGNKSRRASLDEVRAATGYAAGGTPPFGHGCRVFADPELTRHDTVWAAAGTPTTVFAISIAELIRTADATWAPIGR
ncbi:prolyl-tRNA synthetase [bacterium BMS3Abin02]|nr:prolyl-tRNA synthetase [bacterium BMS3Abin02]GBE23031.1 prolyl-tRNA synthetase [bacterium BMS3Bbin01]